MLAVLTGCNSWPFRRDAQPPFAARGPAEAPTVASLVGQLNDNAKRLQVLQCQDVTLDCKEGYNEFSLGGRLDCQQPRNFRLTAKVLGKDAVDIGSNEQEFWFWISKAEPPYQFHCSYEDFQRRPVSLPFPFQPDWVMEAIGMAEYKQPLENYQVSERDNAIFLVEAATSPQGQPMRKVTGFSRGARGQAPQVRAHILQDAKGKTICAAYIKDVQQDRTTGAVLPRRVQLTWPEQKIEMTMKLNEVAIYPALDAQVSARLFTRQLMANVPSFDLARGEIDGPPSALQRVRGSMR
jgi:hypothetical protein